jgi:Bacterial Ig-like domain (group 3)
VITSFGASPTSITAGGSSQLTAVFSGGTGSIDNGGGAATSGSPITITPSTTTTYTLTVDNGSGGKVTSTATVTVVAVPVITSFVASPSSVTAGSGAQLTAVFSGGTGSVDNGVGPVTSGSGVKVTPSATTTYTLTVDNGSGGKVTAPATVTVTGAGTGEGTSISVIAGNDSPAVGQSVNFTATVTPPGATGKVGFGIDSPMITNTVPLDTNSTASMPISFNTSGTHTIYAIYIDSNGSIGGTSGGVENSVTVTAVGTPVITSFGAKPASIASGAGTQLTAVFSGGTGSIDNSVGTVTSGTPVTVSPSATTTYTLTVDNGAGVKVTSTATVTVAGVEGTAVALSLDSIQPVVGQPTTFTATVTPKGATGSVQLITFTVGTPLGNPVQLDTNSQATLTYTFGQASNQGVEAAYTDSNGVIVAYSQVVNFSVAPAPGPAIASFVAASNGIPVGGSTQLTAVFSGGTGSISDNVDSGVIPVTSGTSVTVSPTTTTTYTLTVINGTGTTVTSQVTVAVGAVEGTAISVTPDISTPAVGQLVTFTATVSPLGATGSVQFGVDTNTQLSSPVALDANSSAIFTQTFTTAGGHQVFAYYTDSAGNNAAKTFVTVSVTGGKGGPVITSFGASPTSIAAGGSSQLTAVFSGGAGNIDNGVGTVTSGTPLKVSPTTTTTYTLTVDDGVGDKVTSQTTVTVQQVEGTGISLAQDITSPAVGQTVTFTATVAPPGSTGRVAFAVDNGMPTNSVPLDTNSSATYQTSFNLPGTRTVSAVYIDGNGAYGGSSGMVQSSITLTVSGPPVVESFNAKPSTISAGQSTQLAATFAGGTGTINPGSISITSGTPVPINPTTTTTYTLTVDGGANGTATSQTTVTINGVEGTAMTLALNPGQTLVVGQPATFTATVTPLGATGTVGLIDNIIGVGNPVPLDANSTAQITVTLESSGFNTFVASYIDSNGNFGVSSNELFLGVSATQPGPSIDSFSASPQVVPAGGSTQLTAFFSNGTGSIDNGVGAVTSGIPVTVTPNGTSTTYTLTVTGPGGTTSATTTVATGVEGTAISVTSDVSSPVIGQAVNFTATVTPTGATGSVGFGKNIPQILTTVPLNTNSTATTATYQTSFAAAGPHTIYVFYIDSAGNTVAQSSVTVTVVSGGGGGGIEGNAIALTQTSSAVAGQPVSFTATVTPTGAAGKAGLSLDSGQTFVDSAVLDSTGAATLTATFSTSGTYTVYAYYFDSSGNPAAKTFIQVTVN